MSNTYFDFKQFSIQQDRCAMKVGTDGVLLGAWTPIAPQVLDIGTGTGLIALMIAQRLSALSGQKAQIHIDALEIDPVASEQARENVCNSPWNCCIQVINLSLQNYAREIDPALKYDVIVSNPPFYNATLKPEDEARAVARHKDALPLQEITHFAKNHLSEEGVLSLIYPTSYDTEVMTAAILSGLQPLALCDVLTKKNKPCKRRMATFALPTYPQKEIIRQTLIIRDENNEYAEDYLRLVNDFYLSLK